MSGHDAKRNEPVMFEERYCEGYAGTLYLRIHRPAVARVVLPLVIYLHPGRFVSGNLDETDTTARSLVARLGLAIVAPVYSLAIARPFPAAAEDAYAALVWAHRHAAQERWSARRIAVIGEEAGGNLAAAVAMMSRDRAGPSLAAQVLISPMLDPTLSSCSMRAPNANAMPCSEAYRHYLPHASDRLHPYAAPGLSRRLAGLAPALILSAENDPLRDEADSYAARLIAAGVKTHVARLATRDWSEPMWREMADFLKPLLAPARKRANSLSSTAK